MGRTVFEKIWDAHALANSPSGETLLYIDRHFTHEVTSPVAFEGLRASNRRVRRPDLTFAIMDHNVPTGDRLLPIQDPLSAEQVTTLYRNAREFGIRLFDIYSPFQGIVHVVMPELGLTLPGLTITCGDSHTCTHGAFGALAFGIGTSEGEHVFATQTLWLRRPRSMEIRFEGRLKRGVMAKDVILYLIKTIGTGGAIGHAVEYTGSLIREMNVEERMTLCNMAVEASARTAIICPDEKVYQYLRGTPFAPADSEWDEALRYWSSLRTDHDAVYDSRVAYNVSELEPQVTWGTNPGMTVGITGAIPSPSEFEGSQRLLAERALKYMGLEPGTEIRRIKVDVVFIGSCTNARLYDLLEAARVVYGNRIAPGVRGLVVPGSQLVKRRAERLGLHKIFIDAGFEWKNSGCSMCIAMNEDKLLSGQRCASTSNRNFENRQGIGGRTHLVSPLTAAASAISGTFSDPRDVGLVDYSELPIDHEYLRHLSVGRGVEA
ncbi:MAG: 3-isopropylmalate dehydratase large subunit [Aigarchaeota archaeon]|nr:3-isopropylmalate dehydratase large subunit [Aigarchaeota archaeon]MDW8092118.1 3-isopropylmalate dehydratase large subunit [Nitrososphaerota archaeon]